MPSGLGMSTRLLRHASLASAVLLLILCVMSAVSGVSQQHFEWVHPPQVYAHDLVRDGTWLRAIVLVDDLFVVAYVSATVFLARRLAGGELNAIHMLIAGGGVAAGLIDLEENHHLLTLLRWAELGLPVPSEEVLRRSELSQLKWMLGHAAFAVVGMVMKAKGATSQMARVSLIAMQLPLGALAWAVTGTTSTLVLTWLRYAAFLAGFLLIAWLASRGGVEGVTDERR